MGMADQELSEVASVKPMPVTTGRTEQVAIRLPHAHIERCREIRAALSRPGLEPPSISEVMRAIFAKGLEAWEAELGIEPETAAKKPAKKK
jgi:hypothetical protein